MSEGSYEVVVSAGTLRPSRADAGCVLNDLYREADRLGMHVT